MVACSSKDVLRKTLLEVFVCQNLSLSLACKTIAGIKSWMQRFFLGCTCRPFSGKKLIYLSNREKGGRIKLLLYAFLDCYFIGYLFDISNSCYCLIYSVPKSVIPAKAKAILN